MSDFQTGEIYSILFHLQKNNFLSLWPHSWTLLVYNIINIIVTVKAENASGECHYYAMRLNNPDGEIL